MVPDQVGRAFAHCRQIDILGHPPDQTYVMGQRRAAHRNPKKISTFERREPGVPVIGHPRAIEDRDRMRFEMKVDRFAQTERIPVFAHVDMRDLSQRVNAGVCAACRRCCGQIRFEFGQRRIQRFLYGWSRDLTLPAGIRLSVIFNSKGIARHCLGLAA